MTKKNIPQIIAQNYAQNDAKMSQKKTGKKLAENPSIKPCKNPEIRGNFIYLMGLRFVPRTRGTNRSQLRTCGGSAGRVQSLRPGASLPLPYRTCGIRVQVGQLGEPPQGRDPQAPRSACYKHRPCCNAACCLLPAACCYLLLDVLGNCKAGDAKVKET